MGLTESAALSAGWADGSEVVVEFYRCQIEWFGEWQEIDVVANDGQCPLLGVQLLIGHKLTIDYRDLTLVLE